MMTERIGSILGESLGEVLEIDMAWFQMGWGKYLRVHVKLNVKKPLQRGTTLVTHGGDHVFVMFRYEHLPDCCFACGRLDHHESKCDVAYVGICPRANYIG
ncbi:hypothetical protein REPUB_Repub09cG0063600 [Reevesia pubescens]